MVNVQLMPNPFRSALALAVYEVLFHEIVRPNFRLRPTEKAKSNSLQLSKQIRKSNAEACCCTVSQKVGESCVTAGNQKLG